MINALVIVVHKWIDIGIQLGIDYHVLKGLGQQYSNDSRRCLTEMLQYWLDGNAANGKSHVNWETIIEALKSPSVNESGIAEKICEDNRLQHAASECDSQSCIPMPCNPVKINMYMYCEKALFKRYGLLANIVLFIAFYIQIYYNDHVSITLSFTHEYIV